MAQAGVPQNLLFEYNWTKVTIFKCLLFGGAYFIVTVFELLCTNAHSKTEPTPQGGAGRGVFLNRMNIIYKSRICT